MKRESSTSSTCSTSRTSSSRSTISTRITSTIILQGLGPLPAAERKRLLIPESAKGYPCGVDCAIVAALYMRIMRTCACTGCVAGAVGGAGARAGAVVGARAFAVAVAGLRARVRLLAPARLRLRGGGRLLGSLE